MTYGDSHHEFGCHHDEIQEIINAMSFIIITVKELECHGMTCMFNDMMAN